MALDALTDKYDVALLNRHPDTLVAVARDGLILWANESWFEFGSRNGAAAADIALGQNYFASVSGELRVELVGLFSRSQGAKTPFEFDYECSSPTEFRLFRLHGLPLDDGTTLLVHSLRVVYPHDARASAAILATYEDPTHCVTMCSNCRRTQRADRSGWDWVPEWVRGAPVRVSHGICEICSGFLYGRVAPTRVIVVDGVAPVRRLIARILNAAFYDVVECADAATAREQLAAASFDVLITDALLPDGLGLDLARAARARSPALQCVIATGDGTMATEAGIRWLHKPLEPGALKKLLPPP